MLLEYKGFLATIEYDREIGSFMGSVLNTASPITFYARSKNELQQEFSNSINEWIAVCEERKIKVDRPHSAQMTPGVAREAS